MRGLNRNTRTIATLALALSLLVPASSFAQVAGNAGGHWGAKKGKVPADQAEATKWITDSMKRFFSITQLNDQYLVYSDRQYHYGIALARVVAVREGGDPTHPGDCTVSWQDYSHDREDCIFVYHADKFAAALEFLAAAARQQEQVQQDATLQQFEAQAKAWREAPSKPQMPEAAREHQVLAEYSFKQKETEKAVKEYQAALDIFPTWPEGQFNLATLAGEQKLYDTAIFHMQQYLALAPDAPDAQAAKDSIIIWKDRINTLAQAAAAADNAQPAPEAKGFFAAHRRK